MAKLPTITELLTGYFSLATLNANFVALRDQFTNVVSRDGSTPNTMLGDLDMGDNDIINVGEIDVGTLTVQGINITNYITSANGAANDINGLTLVQGDILYYDGTNIVRLPVGTTGQALKVSGGVPAWGTDIDTDTDTIGVTVEEDDVAVETNVTTINFITGGGLVTSPTAGTVEVDMTGL